jgi:hypothetical protein
MILTKELIKTGIDLLPANKVDVVGKFIDFILCKANNEIITRHLMKLQKQGSAFKFLNDEPDLYSAKNLIEKYQ